VTTPLLSFIVLSYNYQDYIKVTIQSILNQTLQDFEIIVVDDCSTDRSCEVVRSFNDPRIRLIVNERNLGGAGAYNVAVSAACGEWLVNLDADDWIAPEKCVRQLKTATQNPRIDIIGTWVNLVGSDGKPHPDASLIEPSWNGDHALNLVDTWIGKNHLCRSSTMVRRASHLRIGLDDAGMVAAPDYELWTRALAQGCRFHLISERLTFSRLHSRGVTRADLFRSFLEVCFAMSKNIVPLIEKRGLSPTFVDLLRWIGAHPKFPALAPRERHRLFGLLMAGSIIPTYAEFRVLLSNSDPVLEAVGRRALFVSAHSGPDVQDEAQQYIEERDCYKAEHDRNIAYITKLNSDIVQYIEARDYYKARSETWTQKAQTRAMQSIAGLLAPAKQRLSRYFRS
jgi:glycosyltransferase involved in cell wall biosynthesis